MGDGGEGGRFSWILGRRRSAALAVAVTGRGAGPSEGGGITGEGATKLFLLTKGWAAVVGPTCQPSRWPAQPVPTGRGVSTSAGAGIGFAIQLRLTLGPVLELQSVEKRSFLLPARGTVGWGSWWWVGN